MLLIVLGTLEVFVLVVVSIDEGIMEDNVGFGIPSLGVVYGDLSTLPLYVYKNTFEEDIQHSEKVALLLCILCCVVTPKSTRSPVVN
ncbi:hypothetical protein V6N11_021833 [Hibiscus sabdariffa]|uniref:K+ potassium transporter integral membrane domain-containing protein n=1 Tax=Hibiscus sabdariffa TaxID=183260 RepID=A0ABR2THD9_9ROSI